jgi:radical SAM superfamily enzyme YgiQ (UPF0313 family)
MNARYSHTSLGLRWLAGNLGPLRERALIEEFTIQDDAPVIIERLLAHDPLIVGLGVYIWNVELATEVVQVLKQVRPGVTVVIGGPEVSHEYAGRPIFEAADYLVRGEGETAFRELCQAILSGRPPVEKVHETIPATALEQVILPYDLYTDEDIAQRLLYVEASRGCPFRCEFCLSSLDPEVREFPLPPLLEALDLLIARGSRAFKFVDRTFNLSLRRMEALQQFFLERWREGMRLHFEIVPDRLSDHMIDLLKAFPAGGLHLEVGVQTFCPDAQSAISRRQDLERTELVLRLLRTETGALLHADLVAGLPCETMESFGQGVDRLLALAPQAIQLGILKRLPGAPIARHVVPHRMVFASRPPYEVMQTDTMSFEELQELKRIARYFDLFYNSGNFSNTLPLLWQSGPSSFGAFRELSEFLWGTLGRTHQIPLTKQAELLYAFLASRAPDTEVAQAVCADFYRVPGRKEVLSFCGGRRPSV